MEWYINGADGVEHGFTVAKRPGADAGEVAIGLTLAGVEARHDIHGEGLVFVAGGREVLGYRKLKVLDARGQELPATMEPSSDGITISYNDLGATYPVLVDPIITSEEPKLTAADADADDRFGASVSVSEGTAVVGAWGEGEAGSAYVFVRDGSNWSQSVKLTSDEPARGDLFGWSASASGDTIIVGAPGSSEHGGDSGSAYVFVRNGESWNQQAMLTASDASFGRHFGNSVAVSGDTALVGSWKDSVGTSWTGSAYVFTRDGGGVWSQKAKLTAPELVFQGHFGSSVAVSGDTALIGAIGDEDAGSNSGCAYVFVLDGTRWNQQAKLIADDSGHALQHGREMGNSVSLSGDTALVGAKGNGASQYQKAHVFKRSAGIWSQEGLLSASDSASMDNFAHSVSLSGDLAIVGAYGDDDDGNLSGSAYLFTRDGRRWIQHSKLVASDAAGGDLFGISVGVSGDAIIVGGYGDDDGGSSSGSAYLFSISAGSPRLEITDASGGVVPMGSTVVLPSTEVGERQLRYLWIENVGASDLDVTDISVGGPAAIDFGLLHSDITPNPDLACNERTLLGVSFEPTPGPAGMRSAFVAIDSNDPDLPTFTFDVSANALIPDPDQDDDGLPDDFERLHYHPTDLSVTDGSADLDGDGMNDGGEFLAGTDAADPKSILRIAGVEIVSESTVSIEWRSVAGISYAVWASSDLTGGSWSRVVDAIQADGSATETEVPLLGDANYYQIRVSP